MGRTCITVFSGHSSLEQLVCMYILDKSVKFYLHIKQIFITVWTEKFVFMFIDCSWGKFLTALWAFNAKCVEWSSICCHVGLFCKYRFLFQIFLQSFFGSKFSMGPSQKNVMSFIMFSLFIFCLNNDYKSFLANRAEGGSRRCSPGHFCRYICFLFLVFILFSDWNCQVTKMRFG